MKKYILFLLVLFLFFITPVNALTYENYDTSYIFDFSESSIDFDISVDSSDHNLGQLLDNLTSLHSNNYYIMLFVHHGSSGFSNVSVYLVPKSDYSSLNFAYVGTNSRVSSLKSHFSYVFSNFSACNLTLSFNSTNIYESTNYQTLLSYIENGCSSSTSGPFVYMYNYNYNNLFYNNSDSSVALPNLPNNQDYSIPYFSSIPLVYSNSFSNYQFTNSNDSYFKKIIINDVTYSLGDYLPTYYDLYLGSSYDFNNYDNQLNRIFVGSIPKNNLNDFHIDLSFNVNDTNFLSDFSINTYYFGRVNHSSYYTYERIDCSYNGISSREFALDGNYVQGVFFRNGLSCTSDLTSYDYIYLRLDILPTGLVDYTTYNLSLSSSYGNIYNFDNTTNTKAYLGDMYIYEKLDNLSSSFSFFISTNFPKGYYFYLTDSNYTNELFLNRNTLEPVYNLGAYSNFGSSTNTLVNIFNYYDLNPNSTNLKLFISDDVLLSFSSSNVYYYYDSSGNVESVTYTNKYSYSLDSSYDLSYYFGIINNYLDTLNADVYDLSVIVQNCYNLIPQPFSTMFFILFILGCTYLLFKLIKR